MDMNAIRCGLVTIPTHGPNRLPSIPSAYPENSLFGTIDLFHLVLVPTFGSYNGDTFESWGPARWHNGGANILFCDGHVEYGKYRQWVEHRDDVMRRWNCDHEPHPETWLMNLLEYP